MSDSHGSHIWYELMTPDADGARAFYEKVVGWTIDAEPQGEMDYRMIAAPDGLVGGVMKLDAAMQAAGARPIWVGYICVDDVDATGAAMVADGATKFMQTDIPNVGRIALLADPWGGLFYIMTPTPPADDPDATSHAFDPAADGHCGWNELWSTDHKAALAFYRKHFGWEAPEAMDMGPMGEYRFIDHHGVRLGAAMTRDSDGPPAQWNHYWRVPSIAAAQEAVAAAGGSVMMGPHEVPTGDWILIGTDPQGAMFHLVGPKG